MYSISIFILHFTYLGGAYAPNAPPVHGSATAIPGYFNDQVDIELHCTTATDICHQHIRFKTDTTRSRYVQISLCGPNQTTGLY